MYDEQPKTARQGSTSLNDKQTAFVAEYLKDKNATQAAIRAGYSEGTAYSQGQRLLKHVEVSAAIDAGLKELADKAGVSAERVIQELSRIAFSDLRRIQDEDGKIKAPKDWDDDTAAAISSLEVASIAGEVEAVHKIKVWDKNSALEKLCKHLDLYAAQKHELAGKDGDPLPTNDLEVARRIAFALTQGLAIKQQQASE